MLTVKNHQQVFFSLKYAGVFALKKLTVIQLHIRMEWESIRTTRTVWKSCEVYVGLAPCGLRVGRIQPLRFLARCRTRGLNQALSVLSLRLGFECVLLNFIHRKRNFSADLFWVCFLLFIRAIFCVVSLRLYVFCLSVVLVKLSVLTKWLARKTPLRTLIRGNG